MDYFDRIVFLKDGLLDVERIREAGRWIS